MTEHLGNPFQEDSLEHIIVEGFSNRISKSINEALLDIYKATKVKVSIKFEYHFDVDSVIAIAGTIKSEPKIKIYGMTTRLY